MGRGRCGSVFEPRNNAIARVTADAAYDTVAFYEAAGMRDGDCRGSTVQDREGVSASAAVARARSHDHGREDARPAPLEEGKWEARKRCPSPVFWARIQAISTGVASERET